MTSRNARKIARTFTPPRGIRDYGPLRLGTISAVDLGGTPPTVTVHGISMRYADNITTPAVNDEVLWVKTGSAAVVICRLDN